MSLIKDTIKIYYVEEGYLPDYPYHLISDKEMCDAFLKLDDNQELTNCFFQYYYPLVVSPRLNNSFNPVTVYYNLVDRLNAELDIMRETKDPDYELPDWVYAYMIGAVIGPKSEQKDIHDMLVLLHLDNMDDEFTFDICKAIYDISCEWIKKANEEDRVPTIFGEHEVLKGLRLDAAS